MDDSRPIGGEVRGSGLRPLCEIHETPCKSQSKILKGGLVFFQKAKRNAFIIVTNGQLNVFKILPNINFLKILFRSCVSQMRPTPPTPQKLAGIQHIGGGEKANGMLENRGKMGEGQIQGGGASGFLWARAVGGGSAMCVATPAILSPPPHSPQAARNSVGGQTHTEITQIIRS